MQLGVARADHFLVPGWSVSADSECFEIPDSSLLDRAAPAPTWTTTSVTVHHVTDHGTIKDGRTPGVVSGQGSRCSETSNILNNPLCFVLRVRI
ncbi:hypothetical protein MTO96_028810 [Rhipicephalus appendiculatus]